MPTVDGMDSAPQTSPRVNPVLLLIVVCLMSSFLSGAKGTGSIHLPIVRGRQIPQRLRRGVGAGSIGLGDYEDVTYSVLVQVGGTDLPLVLDTGSSDLWVLSTSCGNACSSNQIQVPLYSASRFRPTGLDTELIYGDTWTGTYAEGPIGSDFISLVGLGLQNQYFCAINATNTSVAQSSSSGILGLGFPFNSLLWMELLLNAHNSSTSATMRRNVGPEALDVNSGLSDRLHNMVMRWFPKNDLDDNNDGGGSLVDVIRLLNTTAALRSSIVDYGPPIPRLVAQGVLDSPMFSIALQRDKIQIGGNQGMLSIGQLPPSVQSETLTWVNVRRYSASQGGLRPPSDAPGEVYPVAWEIPLDNVYFDGVKLSRSKMTAPNISLSALMDTGNSLIRGPPDVVEQIEALLGGSRFACSSPHSLVFQISGKLFPVDPRDFISQARSEDPDVCSANLVPTDVPLTDGSGYLYSWNLGDPFLKGVLAAFHYGSLTHPSQNPPRVGLLSTVDPDTAAKILCDDEHTVEQERKGYPVIAEPAPASLPLAGGTGVDGVPLAPKPTVTESVLPETLTNGSRDVPMGAGVWIVALVGIVTWTAWRIVG